MPATLTIDRSNLPGSLADLVIGDDVDSGFTLDPDLSIGVVRWRKETSEQSNVPGRSMGDHTRDFTEVTGSITCHGDDEAELQDNIGVLIEALTQVTDAGFAEFTMTYTHGVGGTAAHYKWKCTEPGDVTPGGAQEHLDDEEMAGLSQSFGFVIVRNPIPILGPI